MELLYMGELARAKGEKALSRKLGEAAELIPWEGCLSDEVQEKMASLLEGSARREKGSGRGWLALLPLAVLALWGIWKARDPASYLLNCPSCGGAVSWPAGLRAEYCPHCGVLLELRDG